MSQNFPDRKRAGEYVRHHDRIAAQLSRQPSLGSLKAMEEQELRISGGQRIAGGPRSRDELTASILELRFPYIAEARAALAGPEKAPLAMSDEDILELVQEDSSSDYNEGVGDFGGYVDWNVKDDVLTVTVRLYTPEADDDPAGAIVRKWRLVPIDQPTRLTDGHEHAGGPHPGWLGHDGHPVHRHEMTSGRTEWERR